MSPSYVAECVAKTTGRYTPTDDFVRSLGFVEEFDQDYELRYIHNGKTLDEASCCMVVDDTDDRRKIALYKKPDVDGYDTDEYSQEEAMEFSLDHAHVPVFFGYVPDEHTLRIIIATTQWLVPPVITPQ